MNPKLIDDLSQRITALLPDTLTQVRDDVENNVRTLLQNTLSGMNLVSREEFDIQAAVLQRTRDKLEKLEKQLEALQTRDPEH